MEHLVDKSLADELLAMAEADQAMRMHAIEDESQWDSTIDESNTTRLKEIVANNGWPTISLVGAEASHAAWLLVQHAPSLDFMKQCLAMMKEAPVGSVNPANIAYLEDRILVMDGKPQLYGTQFQDIGEGLNVYTIQDPEKVDERRASVGLGTFAENEAQVRERYAKPIVE